MWHVHAIMPIFYISSQPYLVFPNILRDVERLLSLLRRNLLSSMDYPQAGHHHGHHYGEDEDPNSVGLHSGEDHHEKHSVMKKVKDKAKKIKDTIKKHGHGQHQGEHGQEFEEEDHEDEDMVEDPVVVQGGPKYASSTVARSRDIPMEEFYTGQSGPTLERTTAMKEDPLALKDGAPFPSQTPRKEDNSREHGANLAMSTATEDPPCAQDSTPQTFSFEPSTTRLDDQEKSRVNLGASMGLEEDPYAPKDIPEAVDPPNYQAKVADPTGDGGEEVGITPIIGSFDKMSVKDNKPEYQFTTGTGSHDQFSQEPLPANVKTIQDLQNTNDYAEKPSDQRTYTEKISSAAISAKNTVASKLGYGGETHEGGDQSAKTAPSVTEYGKKIASTVNETLYPVHGKVAEAGSTVMSKVQGTGSVNEEGPKESDEEGAPDKGVSVKTYLAEKLKPGEEDRALSEVISDALHRRKGAPEDENESNPMGKKLGEDRAISEVFGDALHKRKEEPEERIESKPVGKVTESEEVARRLGADNRPPGEGPKPGDVKFDSPSNVSSGSGVVDKLRGAVTSWFGKGDSQTSPQSTGKQGVSTPGNGDERQGNEVGRG